MKQLISILILTVCCLFPPKVWAADEPITIDLTQEESDEEPNNDPIPSKGQRTLPASVLCIIDFGDKSIHTSLTSEIISYELWNPEGSFMVARFLTPADFVGYLDSITGCYQLRLLTDSSRYVGYIDL